MKDKFFSTEPALTYDDVLLVPQFSEILPSDIDLKSELLPGLFLHTPILSSAMDTVTENRMAIEMALNGGLGVIHKNMDIDRQVEQLSAVKSYQYDTKKFSNASTDEQGRLLVACATGVGTEGYDRAVSLIKNACDIIVLDTAHGHSARVGETIKRIKSDYPQVRIIGGNIATAQACQFLVDCGADAVKIGVGPGSICTTRIIAGIGFPQLQSLLNCSEYCRNNNIPMIADGGIKYSGDIVKALAAGSSAVMLGSLLAGTDESPGDKIEMNGKIYKSYRGMGSLPAMKKGSKERYGQDNVTDKKLVPEGVEAGVEYKGSVKDILGQLIGGIKSGMGYLGVSKLSNLYAHSRFIKLSANGLAENHPHSVTMTKNNLNYSQK
jgi:IMP dehydrogenase